MSESNNGKSMWGNCWTWAIPKFLREGGFLVVSWSARRNYVPHVSWTKDLETIEEFVPVDWKDPQNMTKFVSSFIFKGYVNKKSLKANANKVQKPRQ